MFLPCVEPPEIGGDGWGAMPEYEIHVLDDERSRSIIRAEIEPSDKEAIKSARKLARGRQFEVWRGLECITGIAHLLPPPAP